MFLGCWMFSQISNTFFLSAENDCPWTWFNLLYTTMILDKPAYCFLYEHCEHFKDNESIYCPSFYHPQGPAQYKWNKISWADLKEPLLQADWPSLGSYTIFLSEISPLEVETIFPALEHLKFLILNSISTVYVGEP